jgi:hypothetical protein
MAKSTYILTADDVTPEILAIVESVVGLHYRPGMGEILAVDLADRVESYALGGGMRLDLGNDIRSGAILKIKEYAITYREQLFRPKRGTMKLGVLNTSIVTRDGWYRLETITLEEAKALVASSELDSAVSHESTAEILTTLLGVEIPVSRQLFEQRPGQRALVFKLRGRLETGRELTTQELEEIGFDFKLLTRTS